MASAESPSRVARPLLQCSSGSRSYSAHLYQRVLHGKMRVRSDVPGRIGRHRLRYVAFARPGFLGPAVAVEMGDDVEEFAAPHRVMHDMAVRAHPHRAVDDINVARHRVGRRHAAPADAAGEARHVGAEQTVAHHRMDAVGADHDVGLDLAAVGKARHRVAGAALDRTVRRPERMSVDLSAPAQDGEQIGAMHREVGGAELFPEIAPSRARNVAAGVPRADEPEVRCRRPPH